MSITNGIVTAPISAKEVADLLGIGKINGYYKASDIVLSMNINKWSRHKPISYPQLFSNNDAKGDGMFGLTVPVYTAIGSINTAGTFLYDITHGPVTWPYARPTGGTTSPYRMGDFEGYLHAAVAPVTGSDATCYLDSNNGIQLSYDLSTSDNAHNITIADIEINGVELSQYYLGVVLFKDTGTYIIATSESVMGSGSLDIRLSNMSGYTGDWKAALFASSVPITTTGNIGAGTYVPIEQAYINVKIANTTSLRSVDVQGEFNAAGTSIHMIITISNNSSGQISVSDIQVGIRRTTGNATPASGELVCSYNVADQTVPANSSVTVEMDATVTYSSSYIYWTYGRATGFDTTYEQVAEPIPDTPIE